MKKAHLLFLISLITLNIFSQDVFNVDSVRNINLHFYNSNWRDSLDSYYIQGIDNLELASLSINGTDFDSIGVRWKGNSSCTPGQMKNPMHIELDYIKNQDYYGVSTFKLSNLFKDPSFVREVVMYEFLNWYMPASKSNYVNVYVDNNLLGFYNSLKSINKDFCEEYFGSRKNTRVKCDPLHFTSPPTPIPNCGPPPPDAAAALVLFSPDSACYQYSYEMKSDYGWENLFNLIETIGLDSSNANNILDIDRTLWMLAFDNLFANLDSYIGSGHNYYLYQNNSNRFNTIIWDLNEIFGTFTQGMSPNELKNLSLFYNFDKPQRPLVSAIMAIPNNKKKYLAHYRTLVTELIETDTIVERCTQMQSFIDAYVQADQYKLTSYSEFQNSMTNDQGLALGITSFLADRYSFITSDNDFNKTPPTIATINHPTAQPLYTETVTISADISNANNCILGYRTEHFAPFIYLQMYDDGNHNDGLANDGLYAAEIPAFDTNTQVDYYIYAENSNAGTFLPVRAEYEFFNYIVSGNILEEGKIVINEFMASNATIVADQDDEYDDWIELFNPTSEDINLRNTFLSDKTDDILKWEFPDTIIQANSYLIIWADNDVSQQGLHANFKLSSAGEAVVLSNYNASIIDSISYTTQYTDTSFGRFPNATGQFQFLNPTFSDFNEALSVTNILQDFEINIYPNPAHNLLNIRIYNSNKFDINIVDVYGKQVKQFNSTINRIDISNLDVGIYFIRIKNNDNTIVKKFVKIK